ncbi:MAG: SIMPL domain-containing protein [Candidatus Baltobacteraceae bacterium]
MKRAFIATLLVALLPLASAAKAQTVARPPAPAPNFPQHGPGITVSASGVEHVTATSARVTLRLGSRSNAMIYNAQVLAPIVDAMVRSGVDRSSIQLPPNFQAAGNANFATISGDAANPSLEVINRGIATVGAAIVAIPDAVLQETQITLRAENCGGEQAKARSLAIALARSKAGSIAQQLGVKLGSVVSVSLGDQALQDGSCANTYNISSYGPGIERAGDFLAIPVYSSVTITFAIL